MQLTYYKIWGRLPFISTLLIILLPIFYIFSIYVENFFESICNSNDTFMKFQIYRLLTAGFAYPHLYSVILTQLLLYLEGAELENVIGSGTYFIHLLTKTIIINTITWVFVIPTWFIFNFQFEHRDFGFFPSILCDILVRTYYRQNELRFGISNRLYALIMVLLFIVANIDNISFNLISIVIFAFIEIKYYNGMLIRLQKSTVQILENSLFSLFLSRRDFIQVKNCSDFLFKRQLFRSLDDENISIEQLQDMCDEDEEDEEDEEGKNQEQQNTGKINVNTDNDNQKIQIEYSSKQKEDQLDDNLENENEDDNEYNLQDIQNKNEQLQYNGEADKYNDKNNLVKQPKLIDTINNTEVSQENAAIDTQDENHA